MWKTAFLVSPVLDFSCYMLTLRLVSQLEVVFLLLVDHSLNYTLRSKMSGTNEPFMKTPVTYFFAVTCSQRRAEQSPQGNFRGAFQSSYRRFNLRNFNFFCQVRSRRKHITSARTSQGVWTSLQEQKWKKHIIFLTGMTWRLHFLWDSLQGESSNHH